MGFKVKRKVYHGWIIVITCLLIQAICFGIAQNIQPQFIHYVIKGEGFSLAQFNLLFTIGVVVSAIVSPFIGSLYDNKKINKKLLYVVGAIFAGGGFFLYGLCHHLWEFYVVSGIVQIGASLVSSLGIPAAINAWFGPKKGVPLSIAFAGGGIGNIFLQSISAYLIPKIGYSKAYMVFGITSLVITIPIVLLFIRFPKANEELEVEEEETYSKDKNGKEAKSNSIINWGYTVKELKRNKMFWVLALGWILAGIYIASESVNYVNYFENLNYTALVGTLGSIFALCSIIGNLFGGKLFESLGVVKTLLLAGILITICGVCLIFAPYSKVFCFIFVSCLGLSVYSYMIGPSILTSALFGNKFYGTILGVINVFFSIGFATGAFFLALLQEYLGVKTSWIIITVDSILCYVCIISAAKYFLSKIPEMKAKSEKEAQEKTINNKDVNDKVSKLVANIHKK